MPLSTADTAPKIILLTGAGSGIGRATALHLAGQHLVLADIDAENLAQTKALVLARTPNSQVDVWTVDLSSLSQTVAFTRQLLQTYPRLDVLINNAGAIFDRKTYTGEGIEKSWAVNYLSAFLLSTGLLPLLERSSGACIVNVVSELHRYAALSPQNHTSALPVHVRFKWFILRSIMGTYLIESYAKSKLALVMHTLELADRLTHKGISVNAVHPGNVKTNIVGKQIRPFRRRIWQMLSAIESEPATHAARYVARLSLLPVTTGQYFHRDHPEAPAILAQNPAQRAALWNDTLQLLTTHGHDSFLG